MQMCNLFTVCNGVRLAHTSIGSRVCLVKYPQAYEYVKYRDNIEKCVYFYHLL